ncbi:hypothetical protein LWI29_031095 [Acer saccharum]|uniref:beta-glucosidase n=1 Tax=Acer saccharum TaxID=4024 RepID=A0AA39T6R5_ACESA|nr:hypothetical protein LWI29_031095 [Acer saccharum]
MVGNNILYHSPQTAPTIDVRKSTSHQGVVEGSRSPSNDSKRTLDALQREYFEWRRECSSSKGICRDLVDMVNDFPNGSLSTRLWIPMIYGINAYKATIFPHNVGLGATRQVDSFISLSTLMYPPCLFAQFVCDDQSRTLNLLRGLELQLHLKLEQPAFHMFLHLVSRDPRWGRCYESYSEDHKIVQEMTEIVPGLQGDLPAGSRKGTTILTAIKNIVDPQTEVVYEENPNSNYVKSNNFSYSIIVVDVQLQPHIPLMDALVAAWLPGSEGQAVADILFRDYGFTCKLSRTWFKTVGDPHYDPLF